MTLERSNSPKPDSEDPTSFLWWRDYARSDTRPVSEYLFERAEPVFEDHHVGTSWYTSPAFQQLEVERLWTKTWQLACRENDIPEVGDFIEYEICGKSVLLVRDAPGIKAFHNACRHRGTALALGSGSTVCFSCPFHGWTYNLDGSLANIPARWDFSHVDPSAYGLVPVRAETFDGWVFINLDPEAAPLNAFLGEQVMRHLLVHPSADMWKAWHFGVVVPSNWKVMAEAFFESYHVARTHPDVSSYVSDIQSQYDCFGLHSRFCEPSLVPSLVGGGDYTEQEILEAAVGLTEARMGDSFDESVQMPRVGEGQTARSAMAEMVRQQAAQQGIDLEHVSDAELVDAIVYQIFPNLSMFRNPAGHVAYRFRPTGTDPGACIYEAMNLVPLPPGDTRPRDAPLQMLKPGETFSDYQKVMGLLYLLDQDVSNARLIQKGLQGLDRVVFSKTQERNIVAFHDALARQLGLSGGKEK